MFVVFQKTFNLKKLKKFQIKIQSLNKHSKLLNKLKKKKS